MDFSLKPLTRFQSVDMRAHQEVYSIDNNVRNDFCRTMRRINILEEKLA